MSGAGGLFIPRVGAASRGASRARSLPPRRALCTQSTQEESEGSAQHSNPPPEARKPVLQNVHILHVHERQGDRCTPASKHREPTRRAALHEACQRWAGANANIKPGGRRRPTRSPHDLCCRSSMRPSADSGTTVEASGALVPAQGGALVVGQALCRRTRRGEHALARAVRPGAEHAHLLARHPRSAVGRARTGQVIHLKKPSHKRSWSCQDLTKIILVRRQPFVLFALFVYYSHIGGPRQSPIPALRLYACIARAPATHGVPICATLSCEAFGSGSTAMTVSQH